MQRNPFVALWRTARMRTVTDLATPQFDHSRHAFDALTGFPTLLNTSSNLSGEPNVDPRRDALRTVLATRMDPLALGRHQIRRRP